jgi:hypothetical protein
MALCAAACRKASEPHELASKNRFESKGRSVGPVTKADSEKGASTFMRRAAWALSIGAAGGLGS